ncbi:MAG: glycosyltransferase [Bacteroidales bacterium]|nr:glycosyltransferase [Bacteroidales bacterium]
MKVLLINTYDLKGGAARATCRMMQGLKKAGVDVKMLVQTKQSNDPDVITPRGGLFTVTSSFRPYIDYAIPFLKIKRRVPFFPAYIPDDAIVRKIKEINPDIIQLNWITGGFLRIESLAKLNKPLVWYVHDMWPFTGGCHYAGRCEKYKLQCGACPILNSKKESDLSKKVFLRKQKTYEQIKKLMMVVSSSWMAENVKKSTLLNDRDIYVVPPALDTENFKPKRKSAVRNQLGLSNDRFQILFGAIGAAKNRIKGFHLLIDALNRMKRSDFELLVFGAEHSPKGKLANFRIRYFGNIYKNEMLTDLYSSADFVVVPSIHESFGQVAVEAMACGNPVVAFNQGGLKDIVDHKINGYLVQPYDIDEMASGIQWMMNDAQNLNEMSAKARKKAVELVGETVVTEKLIEIYKRELNL